MDIKSYCGNYNEKYLSGLIRIELDGTYVDKNSDYYQKLVELEEFLKKQDSEAQECGEYIDPDTTYDDENSEYYIKLVEFLNQQEQKYIDEENRWTYIFRPELRHGKPKCIEATKDDGDVLYLRSDQFGFSAPRLKNDEELIACNTKYPYWNYLINSGDDVKEKVENVINWVTTSRTIGGSLIWPIWKNGDNDNFSSKYNFYRGVGSYIEDSVDLTLFEVKNYYTWKKNGGEDNKKYSYKNDVLWKNELNKEESTMVVWLNHFGDFNKFIKFFLMNDFVIKQGNEYIPIDITTVKKLMDITPGEKLTSKLVEEYRESYKKNKRRIMDKDPNKLPEMLNWLGECIEKRSENMIDD